VSVRKIWTLSTMTKPDEEYKQEQSASRREP